MLSPHLVPHAQAASPHDYNEEETITVLDASRPTPDATNRAVRESPFTKDLAGSQSSRERASGHQERTNQ